MAASSEEPKKVSELFDDLWKKYNEINSSEEPTVSEAIQKEVCECIERCERLILMINQLQLFSDNETIDEVTTPEIRFLLLSALLAYFTNKCVKQERYQTVKMCQVHYIDFLTLVKNYGITDVDVPRIHTTEDTDTQTDTNTHTRMDRASMEKRRKEKIARFKEQKATETRLQELYPLVQREHVDDQVQREYYTALVTQWVHTATEELDSIQTELPILEHMAKMKLSGDNKQNTPAPSHKQSQQTKQPLRPFILTKSDLQKQVFGLGYPSIPTYTLDEFYDAQVAKGQLPDMGHAVAGSNLSEQEAEEQRDREREEKEERDDPESLQKAREWDDWKDDHRRGWGNTHNKG